MPDICIDTAVVEPQRSPAHTRPAASDHNHNHSRSRSQTRPRANSSAASTQRKSRPTDVRGKELFDPLPRDRSASVSMARPSPFSGWTGRDLESSSTGTVMSLSRNAGRFFFGETAFEGQSPADIDSHLVFPGVDSAPGVLAELASELEAAKRECDRAEAVATRVNGQLGAYNFWAEVSMATGGTGAISCTPSISPDSPSPLAVQPGIKSLGGRMTVSPPNSTGGSPQAAGFIYSPPTSPNRGLTPSPTVGGEAVSTSLEADRLFRSMRARLRALETAVSDSRRGAGVETAEAAETERDYVLTQLRDVEDGALKEVADELGAIRRVWIELFEDANFDIEMLRNKLHEGSADVTRLETELLDVVQELGSLKERLALTRPEEDNAHALAHDEVEADLHDKAKLQLQQAEGLKMIEDTKKALETTHHAHVSETRALADEQMQLELLEEEEQSLQAEVTDVVQALTEAEHGLAQAVEQEEQIVHQLVVHENVSATAEVHLEQLTEVLESQSADLDQQERARDALLESRTLVERDRRDESFARQSEHDALRTREAELMAEIVDIAGSLSSLGEHKHETRQRHAELARELQEHCSERPFSTGSLPEIDTLLKKIQGIKKDEYKEALGELADEVDRLRDELRELEASHAAHKQYIDDNNLVLEHLDNRTAELELGRTPRSPVSSPTWSEESHCTSPTRQLIRTLKEHSSTPRSAARPDMDSSVHMAVESEIEMSRLAKVVHQTSLAIRATVAKRNRLEEWSRANSLRTWVSDASVFTCTACQDEFNFFNRRHHCRVCGKIFCADCSQLRVKIAKHWSDVRCCERCMDELEELACVLSDEILPEAPSEPIMPRCMSSVCRGSTGSTCYSPACQRYLADSALDFAKHLRFEALLLEVKLKCGRAQNTSDELFFASIRARVPESEWGDFLFQSLTNGLSQSSPFMSLE